MAKEDAIAVVRRHFDEDYPMQSQRVVSIDSTGIRYEYSWADSHALVREDWHGRYGQGWVTRYYRRVPGGREDRVLAFADVRKILWHRGSYINLVGGNDRELARFNLHGFGSDRDPPDERPLSKEQTDELIAALLILCPNVQ